MSSNPSAPGPVPAGAQRAGGGSLRTRLATGVLGIVLVMSALMGTLSTLTLRHTLMERLDTQLAAAFDRSTLRRHDAEPADPSGSDGSATDAPEPTGPTDSPDSGDSGDSGRGRKHDGHPVPPGLDAVGQPVGTLVIVSSGEPDGSSVTDVASTVVAGYIDDHGTYQSLSEAETASLLALEPLEVPVTVEIDSLGSYRVMVCQDEATGDLVVIGLSLAGDHHLVRTQLLIEGALALTGAVIAALAGRAMVRSSLAPLERVSCAAERVASQPLASGEVSIAERVAGEDLASSQEVGQVGRALNTLLDHVERALAARQRSETQVRQFVADASHELRTPLASIRGYTELIAREGADAAMAPEAVRALERVHSESVRMTGLVEDLLLLARLDAGRELRREEVDLLGILLDAVSDARAAGPDHQWDLDLAALEADGDGDDLDAEPPTVTGDEARLRQVLVNLLANARVHTPAGTRVVTRLARGDGTWVVTVSDNGPGIDPAMRERIFERFARGDASRERHTGSTGLGMSIALAIVQSHAGTLTVDSVPAAPAAEDGEDHGTTFTLTLPAARS